MGFIGVRRVEFAQPASGIVGPIVQIVRGGAGEGVLSAALALMGLGSACDPESKKAAIPVYVQLDSKLATSGAWSEQSSRQAG